MMHHFAHHAGQNCEYGYETSLHLAAKEILSHARKIMLPPVYVHLPDSPRRDELLFEEREIPIDHVELEKQYGDIIPDVVIYAGGKQLFVEVFVTHRIDDKKLKKLQRANISTIEIDLSKRTETMTTEDLTAILLSSSSEKKWKYNAVAQQYVQRFLHAADERKIIHRGFAIHVDNCPIRSRVWHGKSYANVIDDCSYCQYCISCGDTFILCSGRLRIATAKDFESSLEKRVCESNDKINAASEKEVTAGLCPYCGGELVKRQSRYGIFLGCRNYPHCRFTASLDTETGEIILKQ